ncbi:MAG: acyl carrier protein [Chthoniobacterales bacterium]
MIANKSDSTVEGVKEKVRAFILEYAAGHGVTEVKDNEPLLRNNIIDSLGVFRLIDFLEENFPLTVEDTDMEPEGFDNLDAITAFIIRKTSAADAQTETKPSAEPVLANAN